MQRLNNPRLTKGTSMKFFISFILTIIFLPFILAGVLWSMVKVAFITGTEICESLTNKLIKHK